MLWMLALDACLRREQYPTFPHTRVTLPLFPQTRVCAGAVGWPHQNVRAPVPDARGHVRVSTMLPVSLEAVCGVCLLGSRLRRLSTFCFCFVFFFSTTSARLVW